LAAWLSSTSARPVRVPLDGYLKLGGSFYRAPIGLVHQRVELRFDRDRVWIRHAGTGVAGSSVHGVGWSATRATVWRRADHDLR